MGLSSLATEPGSCLQRVFAALGSRRGIPGTTLAEAALSPRACGLGRPRESKFGLNPSQEARS